MAIFVMHYSTYIFNVDRQVYNNSISVAMLNIASKSKPTLYSQYQPKTNKQYSFTLNQSSLQQAHYPRNHQLINSKQSIEYKHKQLRNSIDGNSFSTQGQSELAQRYASVVKELNMLQSGEVMNLLLEEIDQHERNRRRAQEVQMGNNMLREEVSSLKNILQKKRQDIARLCQTQTRHLNLIQRLQQQVGVKPPLAQSHYLLRYKQLQTVMNQYMASTNEAHQTYQLSYNLIKHHNSQLLGQLELRNRQLQQQKRQREMVNKRLNRTARQYEILLEKCQGLRVWRDNLQQENIALKKEMGEMRERVREMDEQSKQSESKQMHQEQLMRENQMLSNQLDLIRQKMNENQNISRDLLQRMQQHNEQTVRLREQLQSLRAQKEHLVCQIQELRVVRQELESQSQQLSLQARQLAIQKGFLQRQYGELKKTVQIMQSEQCRINQTLNQLSQQRQMLTQKQRVQEQHYRQQAQQLHQRQQAIAVLQQEISSLRQQEEQLINDYQQQRQSKQQIKSQLIELAHQVTVMEETYQREMTQNEQIKIEIQKFWEMRNKQQNSSEVASGQQELERQGSHSSDVFVARPLVQRKNNCDKNQSKSKNKVKSYWYEPEQSSVI